MTRKITPAQLDEIEAAAKEATPGLWGIVVLNSPTALALVAEVRELRAKVERVREIIDGPNYAELQLDLIEEVLEEECWDAAHETPWTDGPVNPYREEA